MKKIYFALLFVACTCLSCDDKYPDLGDGIYAEFITSEGVMVTELFYEDVPATVANFVALAEGNHPMADSIYAGKPYYNGLKFHRILKDFMIQGGDPTGTGSGSPGYRFHDELKPDLKHDTIGMLSMANAGYGTNGSQFFILHSVRSYLDGYDANGNLKDCKNRQVYCHTIWGKLRIGFDVLDKIANVEVTGPQKSTPVEPVLIKEVNIIRKGGAARSFDAPAVFKEQLVVEEERVAEAEAARLAKFESFKNNFDDLRPKAETLASGLQVYWNTKSGGAKPKIGSKVLVDYAGFYPTGELFDTSIQSIDEAQGSVNAQKVARGLYKPAEMTYSPDAQLIPGFKEALQLMNIGDKVTVFVPYHLGYGERGSRGIPPKADLIFELEIKGLAGEK